MEGSKFAMLTLSSGRNLIWDGSKYSIIKPQLTHQDLSSKYFRDHVPLTVRKKLGALVTSRTASCAANYVPFRFLDIPYDIRYMFYTLYLPSGQLFTSSFHHRPIGFNLTPVRVSNDNVSPKAHWAEMRSRMNLMQTSRQIHDECIEVFFIRNTVVLSAPLLTRYYKFLGQDQKLLRKVRLTLRLPMHKVLGRVDSKAEIVRQSAVTHLFIHVLGFCDIPNRYMIVDGNKLAEKTFKRTFLDGDNGKQLEVELRLPKLVRSELLKTEYNFNHASEVAAYMEQKLAHDGWTGLD